MTQGHNMLPVCRVNELATVPVDQLWLIEDLWTRGAVGIIGGPPKCCKSWLGLDMAVSVASGTPCLGHFPVKHPGAVLIFLAEDALPDVRTRIEALCVSRSLDINRLDLYVITAPCLRLDRDFDQQRLKATLATFKPHLLVLDPLVRLHRLDENSAADISSLLALLREMQRTYDTAIILVHHTSKRKRTRPGQALRGSSDLHAFGDSNLYLAAGKQHILVTVEHRANKPPQPFEMKLLSMPEALATHLKIVSTTENHTTSLPERTLALLKHLAKPVPRTTIRKQLKVNNQRLGQSLAQLDQQGFVVHTPNGWLALTEPSTARQNSACR